VMILLILLASLVLFLWGRWRHDVVAVAALLAAVLTGLVPASQAFSGFSHPAVITVAAVLILSSGLQSSGAVDMLTRKVLPQTGGPFLTTAALTGLAAVLSAFINNIGALALLMPVAIQIAARNKIPSGQVLMPLAFGSILGGMMTLIGTPPNIIVSGFRPGPGFVMFDFLPVGASVAAVGVVFVVAFSRWLVPRRERVGIEGFETGPYVTEVLVQEGSKAAGLSMRDIETRLEDSGAQVIALTRDEHTRIPAPSPFRKAQPGDILVIEAEPEKLTSMLTALGLKLAEEITHEPASADVAGPESPTDGAAAAPSKKIARFGDFELIELVAMPNSLLVGRSASDIRLRDRYGINLLAISRLGPHAISRLRSTPIRGGDVLLMQGLPEAVREFGGQFGCVPLASRDLRIVPGGKAWTAAAILACVVVAAATGLVPVAVAFVAGVLAAVVAGVISSRTLYDAVDWPVIVLLGALIPLAGAMSSTGAADLVALLLLDIAARGSPAMALIIILVVTMTLSDFMNNAATAATMSPIALSVATRLGVHADPFLMAVAIGASCAFLTPIGHQNNLLILGPGGFRFGDYWRLGLPLEALVVAVAVPMLLLVWQL
jgi:di/tricarboxylate transporter